MHSTDAGGHPLLVALHPRDSGAVRVAEVRMMFGKENSLAYVMDRLQNGKVVYMPKEEIGRVKEFADGRQLPSAGEKDGSVPPTAVPPRTDRSAPSPPTRRLVSRPITISVLSDEALGKYASADPKGWEKLRTPVSFDEADLDRAKAGSVAFSGKTSTKEEASQAPLRSEISYLLKPPGRLPGRGLLDQLTGKMSDLVDHALNKTGVYDMVAPLSGGDQQTRALAQALINAERQARYLWNGMAHVLTDRYTPEQRPAM